MFWHVSTYFDQFSPESWLSFDPYCRIVPQHKIGDIRNSTHLRSSTGEVHRQSLRQLGPPRLLPGAVCHRRRGAGTGHLWSGTMGVDGWCGCRYQVVAEFEDVGCNCEPAAWRFRICFEWLIYCFLFCIFASMGWWACQKPAKKRWLFHNSYGQCLATCRCNLRTSIYNSCLACEMPWPLEDYRVTGWLDKPLTIRLFAVGNR